MTSASAAIAALVALLAEAGVTATREASGFSPDPIGVLVGLPTKIGATLGGESFEVPVYVVSGDPVSTSDAVDRLYAEADAIAVATATARYSPTTWGGSSSKPPLPAIEITVSMLITNDPEEG